MVNSLYMMDKFDFLLGDWTLEYQIPASAFSKAATGAGKGTFKRELNDRYVYFNYTASLTTGETKAHAVFAWDEKSKIYRYWWFEDSGNFLSATCSFVNDDTLFLNWHDTLLIQTFRKVGANKVKLQMEHPSAEGQYEPILNVILSRK